MTAVDEKHLRSDNFIFIICASLRNRTPNGPPSQPINPTPELMNNVSFCTLLESRPALAAGTPRMVKLQPSFIAAARHQGEPPGHRLS
jgi:hypothetical protein